MISPYVADLGDSLSDYLGTRGQPSATTTDDDYKLGAPATPAARQGREQSGPAASFGKGFGAAAGGALGLLGGPLGAAVGMSQGALLGGTIGNWVDGWIE